MQLKKKNKTYNDILTDIREKVVKQIKVNKDSKVQKKLEKSYSRIQREEKVIEQNEEIKVLLARVLKTLGDISEKSGEVIDFPEKQRVIVENPVEVKNLNEIKIPKMPKKVEMKQTKWIVDLFEVVTEPMVQVYKQLKKMRHEQKGYARGKV